MYCVKQNLDGIIINSETSAYEGIPLSHEITAVKLAARKGLRFIFSNVGWQCKILQKETFQPFFLWSAENPCSSNKSNHWIDAILWMAILCWLKSCYNYIIKIQCFIKTSPTISEKRKKMEILWHQFCIHMNLCNRLFNNTQIHRNRSVRVLVISEQSKYYFIYINFTIATSKTDDNFLFHTRHSDFYTFSRSTETRKI